MAEFQGIPLNIPGFDYGKNYSAEFNYRVPGINPSGLSLNRPLILRLIPWVVISCINTRYIFFKEKIGTYTQIWEKIRYTSYNVITH